MKTKVPKGKSFSSWLYHHRACLPAQRWAGKKSLRTAWRTCNRGDWLLWLAVEAGVPPQLITLAACDCARLVLPYTKGRTARKTIRTAELWAEGKATRQQVVDARPSHKYVSSQLRQAVRALWAAEAATGMVDGLVVVDETALYAAMTQDGACPVEVNYRRMQLETARVVRARIPFDQIEHSVKRMS